MNVVAIPESKTDRKQHDEPLLFELEQRQTLKGNNLFMVPSVKHSLENWDLWFSMKRVENLNASGRALQIMNSVEKTLNSEFSIKSNFFLRAWQKHS